MAPSETSSHDEVLALWIQPRSSRQEVAGEREQAVVIRLQAPPVDGAANRALLRFLAERLGVPLGAVQLVRGQTGRRKWVQVQGYTASGLRRTLLAEG